MRIPPRGSIMSIKEPKKRNGAQVQNRPNRPSEEKILEEIRTRAYYRFLERGGESGNEWNDWFQAEREVRKQYQPA